MYYYDIHVNTGKSGYSVGIKDTEIWKDFDMYGVDIKKVSPYMEEDGDVYLIDSVEEITKEQFEEWFESK